MIMSPTQIPVSSHRNLWAITHIFWWTADVGVSAKIVCGVEDSNLFGEKLLVKYLIPVVASTTTLNCWSSLEGLKKANFFIFLSRKIKLEVFTCHEITLIQPNQAWNIAWHQVWDPPRSCLIVVQKSSFFLILGGCEQGARITPLLPLPGVNPTALT